VGMRLGMVAIVAGYVALPPPGGQFIQALRPWAGNECVMRLGGWETKARLGECGGEKEAWAGNTIVAINYRVKVSSPSLNA
jgi:hypothetical protein